MNKSSFILLPAPVIILSHPQLGANIGAAARAMKNCGFSELRLIKPRDGWPNPEALPMATHASDILENVTLYEDLASACFDITQLYATTARPRELQKTVLNPRIASQQVARHTKLQLPKTNLITESHQDAHEPYTKADNSHGYKAAFLFGSERVGLTNDEIVLADYIVEAALNPESNSLNLAQAVMIMCWEFLMATGDIDNKPDLPLKKELSEPAMKNKQEILKGAATLADQSYFFERFDKLLEEKGFFTAEEKAPTVKRNLRNFFVKAQLTKQELLTWHGIVTLFNKQK